MTPAETIRLEDAERDAARHDPHAVGLRAVLGLAPMPPIADVRSWPIPPALPRDPREPKPRAPEAQP